MSKYFLAFFEGAVLLIIGDFSGIDFAARSGFLVWLIFASVFFFVHLHFSPKLFSSQKMKEYFLFVLIFSLPLILLTFIFHMAARNFSGL